MTRSRRRKQGRRMSTMTLLISRRRIRRRLKCWRRRPATERHYDSISSPPSPPARTPTWRTVGRTHPQILKMMMEVMELVAASAQMTLPVGGARCCKGCMSSKIANWKSKTIASKRTSKSSRRETRISRTRSKSATSSRRRWVNKITKSKCSKARTKTQKAWTYLCSRSSNKVRSWLRRCKMNWTFIVNRIKISKQKWRKCSKKWMRPSSIGLSSAKTTMSWWIRSLFLRRNCTTPSRRSWSWSNSWRKSGSG